MIARCFMLTAAIPALADGLAFGDQRQAPEDDSPDTYHHVAWFHPPKTGTSFASTIFHYASKRLPATVSPGTFYMPDNFFKKYSHYLKWSMNWFPGCDHMMVTDHAYEKHKGHFIALFREPRQRANSAWRHKAGQWKDIVTYSKRIEGAVVKQLAGQEHGETWTTPPWLEIMCVGGKGGDEKKDPRPTPDLEKALTRLREGFKFVGLTEEYDLSVCLFHAKFGGTCKRNEFQNMRKTSGHNDARGWNTTALDKSGFTDRYDTPLYEEAKKIFWAEVKAYGIGRDKCRELCPEAEDVFPANPQGGRERSGAQLDWPDRFNFDDGEEDVEHDEE